MMHCSSETIKLFVAAYMSYSSSSMEKKHPRMLLDYNCIWWRRKYFQDTAADGVLVLPEEGVVPFPLSPCFPVKVLLGCCCRRRKQEQDLVPGFESSLSSSQHQPHEIYGKDLRCILVVWGQLKCAGVVAPQHPHPTRLGEAGRNQKACVLVDSPQGEGKAKQGKAGQCKARPGKCLSACRARAQQPLFSWGWRVGGGAERNKQGFQMSSSPLKSPSLKHICVSRAVCSKNRLSQLLFSVLSVGHLYGSFFCLFKSDPLVYKGSVQPELYRESCSQHFLIS